MSVQVIAPVTDAAQQIYDLSLVTGVATFEVDGNLGAAEEVTFEVQMTDETWRGLLQDTAEVKLTLSNTVYSTESKQRLRLNKTATAAAVGVKLSAWGL